MAHELASSHLAISLLILVSALVDRVLDDLLLLEDVLVPERLHVCLELLLRQLVGLVHLLDLLLERAEEVLEPGLVGEVGHVTLALRCLKNLDLGADRVVTLVELGLGPVDVVLSLVHILIDDLGDGVLEVFSYSLVLLAEVAQQLAASSVVQLHLWRLELGLLHGCAGLILVELGVHKLALHVLRLYCILSFCCLRTRYSSILTPTLGGVCDFLTWHHVSCVFWLKLFLFLIDNLVSYLLGVRALEGLGHE